MTDTQQRLEAIKARVEAATDGPWRADKGRPNDYVNDTDVVRAAKPINVLTDVVAICNRSVDFIAHAREDVPWLLEKVEDLHNALEVTGEEGEDIIFSLKQENHGLRAMLKRVEWCSHSPEEHGWDHCPQCAEYRADGHHRTCELDAAIGEQP